MPKLTVEALAIPEATATFVSIYVSAINDGGSGVTGYKMANFNLSALHPIPLTAKGAKPVDSFSLKTSHVQDLGDGCYKVICENGMGGKFLPGRYVLSLSMMMPFSKQGRGQTLVTFDI